MDYTELHEEIDRLPEKYRQPIVLCYLQGRTQIQAAETLGWPLGTVQIRLHRGRERLRSRLTRRGAGLVGLTTSDLAAPPFAPSVPGPEWTETTARAAVRFATGKGTAGLIAPVVSGLAERVLTSMVSHSLSLVALTAFALVICGARLFLTGPSSETPQDTGPHREPRPATVDDTRARATPRAPLREAPAMPIAAKSQAEGAPRRAEENPKKQSFMIVPAPGPPGDEGVLAKFPISPGRTQSLISTGLRSAGTPAVGRELFERVWVKDDPRGHGGDGLGPVFNGQSCVGCHNQGGSGGAGGVDRNVEIATVTDNRSGGMGFSYSFSMDFGAGRFEYRLGDYPQAASRLEPRVDPRTLAVIHPGFRVSPSVVLHRYGTNPSYNDWRGSVPGQHGSVLVRTSERNPPPLFGAGLIDAIPDEVLEAAAKRKFPSSTAVKGRVGRLKDGRIGRFGWKAQTATLKDFVLSAAAGEMGLEVPGRQQAADPRLPGLGATALDMDEAECNVLVEYVRSLRVPVVSAAANDKESAQLKLGMETFKSIGCASCHTPKLGDVTGIYSDLLLHDMGPRLGDADAYTVFVSDARGVDSVATPDAPRGASGTASSREWRTPPLWGLRDSGPYLHDGRAANVDQAVALHGGQGTASARRFAELSPKRKQNLEAFLMSLVAPPAN